MSDLSNVRSMLEAAEAAANAGDLVVADDLLRRAAHIQETELGPVHPDLANTLNNLAIVAETTGRIDDAEMFYRRAVAITAASLQADDPRIASSRKNLEDFCRDRGLPIEVPPIAAPSAKRTQPEPTPPVPDEGVHDKDAPIVAINAAPNRRLPVMAIGVVALLAVLFLAMRSWSPREVPATAPAAAPSPAAAPKANESAPPAAAPAPITSPRTSTSRDDKAATAAISSRAPGRASSDLSLVTSQLCRTLSTGNNWRCDPAGQSVPPGALVFYTRVTSPRDATLVHRWYRGDTLRKTARLRVAANTTDGYRTYSRQTVRSGEDWRVEARNAAGDLLYEQRVSVR